MITTEGGAPVEVRRSARRTRTVDSFWEYWTEVLALPERFTSYQ